jgi:multiple sugar transport system substrate-binding protein
MPVEIEFSIMDATGGRIRPLLDQFEAETGIHVRLRLLAWDSAWGMFVRAGLYGDGPDVSEVGTTWVGDLVGMNALRPYDTAEIAALGKPAAFAPAAWRTAARPSAGGGERVWSIPWLTGARLILYRPALLEQAGIDPHTDFRSGPALGEAVDRLAATGVRVPWTTPTGYTHTTLLNIASWVWAAGGDFIAPDGRSARFTEPQALAGMADYFRLGRALAPEVRHLNGLEPDEYFLEHADAAMTISGPWLFCQARERWGDLSGRLGAALPPGASFVGGSNLVVWKHSRHPEAAARLVRFLTQNGPQVQYTPQIGLLPARAEALENPRFTGDPFWSTAIQGLKTGRGFPLIRLWGLVEDRLTAGLSAVWNDVLAGQQPEPALRAHLEPLARRLDVLLKEE